MSTGTRPERSRADARKGLIGLVAEALYEASLRRTLKVIKVH